MTLKTQQHALISDKRIRRFDGVGEMLPDVDNPTPLIRVRTQASSAALYLKVEWLNPFGSVKDRTAAYLLSGLRDEGTTQKDLVEASSGNTAIALAGLAALEGRKLIATIPDGVPEETKIILRMLGAEVWETPDDLCPVDNPRDGAIALARAIVASEGGDRYQATEQYENLDNVRAHYETTGPEVWRQTEGRVTAFVAGLGTTGTLTGVGRYLKEMNPDVRVIGVEPEPGHRLPGLKSFKEAKVPTILDRSVLDEIIVVGDTDAYETTKRIWRQEALMVGPSTGAVVHAAGQIGGDDGDLIVGISADSGIKYTSYFEEILGDEGRPTI